MKLEVGDFVRLRREDDSVYIVVAVAERPGSVFNQQSATVLGHTGRPHYISWAEMSNGEWPCPVIPTKPGKERGHLNRLLDKWRRKYGKAL